MAKQITHERIVKFDDVYGDPVAVEIIDNGSAVVLAIGCYPKSAHLNQEMVKAILPAMIRFAKIGEPG
jgi:hypothetical protein